MGLRDLRKQWREISLEKKLAMFVAPVFVAIATAVLVPLSTGALGGGGDEKSETRAPVRPVERLEVLDLVVGGGEAPRFGEGTAKPQFLDITVRNTGETVSVITGATFRIRDFALLRICEAGGGLEPTAKYDVELPSDPTPDDVVEAKVSQQIPPHEADRFVIRLNVPFEAMQFGMRLYYVDVALVHDASARPVPAGSAVVSVPFNPDENYFPASFSNFDDLPPGEVRDCYVDNEEALRRFLALEGARSPALTEAVLE